MHRNRTPRAALAALLSLTVLVVAACGGSSDVRGGDAEADAGAGSTKLSLVAYSTPQVVYDELIPAFRETPEGDDVGFSTSFGPSGEQSRAVEAGQDADVVTFSIEPDMTRLVEAGIVAEDWQSGETKGLVSRSVVSFIVRPGNPENIRTWDDLLREDVEVLTPNPFTSGAAKWNLMGAYAAFSDGGRDPERGLERLRQLITENVKAQDKSGREALQNFLGGTGDVLLSYEYEAITAQKNGEEVELVIPDETIDIEIAIAATKDAPPQAQRFVDYVLSEEGQRLFVGWGYRPVVPSLLEENRERFPEPEQLFTIRDFGGWSKVNDEFFDPENGSIAEIEEEAGVSTAS